MSTQNQDKRDVAVWVHLGGFTCHEICGRIYNEKVYGGKQLWIIE